MSASIKKFQTRLKSHPATKKVQHFGAILYNDVKRCDLFKHASAMAYLLILSIIPSLAAVFSLISLFKPLLGKQSTVFGELEEFILKHLATGSGEQVVDYLEKFLGNLDITKIGLTGFAGLIFSLALFLNQIEEALNRIWLVPKARGMVTRFIYFWTFLTLGAFLTALAVGVISGFSLSNLIPSFGNEAVKTGSGLIRILMPFAASYVFFLFLYKIVPNCRVPLKDAASGALLATILVQVAGSTYGFYVAKFTKYQVVYGALAAVPMFLFWLYLNAVIILLGALFSWRMEQGFVSEASKNDRSMNPIQRLREHHVQSIMPFVVMTAIYRKFQLGDGDSFTGRLLAEKMYVPTLWILDALQALEKLGYVHPVSGSTEEEGAYLSRKFVPVFPAESVRLEKLLDDFTRETRIWIRDWSCDLDVDVKGPLLKIIEMDRKTLIKSDFDNVLAATA